MLPTTLLAADLAATLSLAEASEARVRSTGVEEVIEAETRPALQLSLRSRRYDLALAYSPSILVQDQAIDQPQVLQTGVAGVSWHTRRLRLSFGQDLTVGDRVFLGVGEAALPGSTVGQDPTGPAPALQPVPSVEMIPYLAYSSTAALGMSWTRRLDFASALSYRRSGAADNESRAYLPVARGPYAEASLNYRVTRADTASTHASGSLTDYVGVDDTRTVGLLECSERWAHRFSRRMEAYASAGLAQVWYRSSPGEDLKTRTGPVGEVGASTGTSTRDTGVEGSVSARFAPIVDQLTGSVTDRISTAASGTYTVHRFAVTTRAGYSQSLPTSDPDGMRLFYVELASAYRASRHWTLELGGRPNWQQFNDDRQDPPMAWMVFLRASYQDTLARF